MDPRLLEQLHEPGLYPNAPDKVEVIQTHLSVVCIAGEDVYKLKKPVQFSFVDFSTLEKRKHFCEEELRLNRRLCPELYRDVVPLYQTGEHTWSFQETSDTIADYAVLMKRLPEDRMMDGMLEQDLVTKEHIQEIAQCVSRFHRESRMETGPLPEGIPDNLRAAIFGNFEATESHRETIFDAALYDTLQESVQRDFKTLYPKMQAREKAGRVVDGHGDLHARNICLTSPISIFDCIEFRPQFRIVDQATENAFMVMDLIHRGHPEFARLYLETYLQESGDEGQEEVLPSLISYRAMVRAKVSAMTAADADVEEKERASTRSAAQEYMRLAAAALLEHHQLFVMGCGLPGTGKSTCLRQLGQETGWSYFSSDLLRKELAGVAPHERLSEAHYTEEFSVRTYSTLLERALQSCATVPALIDANFLRPATRKQAIELARSAGAIPVILWFQAPESVIQERLGLRSQDPKAESDANWEVYQKLQKDFVPPAASEGAFLLEIPTDGTVSGILNRVLKELLKKTPNFSKG